MDLISNSTMSNRIGRLQEGDCPLCMKEMDLTDRELKACKCGYEICVWCWHQIMCMAEKEDGVGRCPACHTKYDKESKLSMQTGERHAMGKYDKTQKSGKAKSRSDSIKKEELHNLRIIRRDVVHILGIPAHLANEQTLRQKYFFGQYGKILRIDITETPGHSTTRIVFVKFSTMEEAVRCILVVNGYTLAGRTLKASFAATRYCNEFLKNLRCRSSKCTFLHEAATKEDICKKEEVFALASCNFQKYSRNVSYEPAWSHGDCLPPLQCNTHSNSSATSSKPLVRQAHHGQRGHGECIASTCGEKSNCFPTEDSLTSTSTSARPTYACIAGLSRPSGQRRHVESIPLTSDGEKTSNFTSGKPTYASITGSTKPSDLHRIPSITSSSSSSAHPPEFPAFTYIKTSQPSVSLNGWVGRDAGEITCPTNSVTTDGMLSEKASAVSGEDSIVSDILTLITEDDCIVEIDGNKRLDGYTHERSALIIRHNLSHADAGNRSQVSRDLNELATGRKFVQSPSSLSLQWHLPSLFCQNMRRSTSLLDWTKEYGHSNGDSSTSLTAKGSNIVSGNGQSELMESGNSQNVSFSNSPFGFLIPLPKDDDPGILLPTASCFYDPH